MSFLSVEPQSRVLLGNYSNSLLAQFDAQLDILADRYLAFFRERSHNVVRVLHLTLTVRFLGEILRPLSQLSYENQPATYLGSFVYLEVSILYGNSIARQKPLMPHLAHVRNQPLREQHGIK